MSSLVTFAETAEHGVSDVGERSVHFCTGLNATSRLTFGGQVKASWRKDSVGQWQVTLPVVHTQQSIDPATLDIRTSNESLRVRGSLGRLAWADWMGFSEPTGAKSGVA